MSEMLDDIKWALLMIRARRYRRKLLFSWREKFDAEFVAMTSDGRRIAQPYALYHATKADFDRAIANTPKD